jgi:hypothetical protein
MYSAPERSIFAKDRMRDEDFVPDLLTQDGPFTG